MFKCPYCGANITKVSWHDFIYVKPSGRTYTVTVDLNVLPDGTFDMKPLLERARTRSTVSCDDDYELASFGTNRIFKTSLEVGAKCKKCGNKLK